MFKKIIYVFLMLMCFLPPKIANSCLTHLEDDDKAPFNLLFRAKDKLGNSALFVPSEHGFPWESFPTWFKERVLSNQTVVVESLVNEQSRELTQRLVSRENVRVKDYLTEKPWFFPEDHEKYQELYTKILTHFNEKGYDYSYLKDISRVKPGLLAYMNICIFNPYQSKPALKEGMDSKIEEIFSTTPEKKLFGLEDPKEIMSCFGLYSASYDDVQDEFSIEYLSKFVNQLRGIESEEEVHIQSTSNPSFYGDGLSPTNLREALASL